MPKTTSLPGLKDLALDFPSIKFIEDEVFYWSAKESAVHYCQDALDNEIGLWQLLHEIGHAGLNHKNFSSSIALLRMEAQAWQEARKIASEYSLSIAEDYIEKCLDTYRDWLYSRSKCPSCTNLGLETHESRFHCFNCGQDWQVALDQRSRCYRHSIKK